MLERDWKTEEDSEIQSDPEDKTTDDQGDTDSQGGEYVKPISDEERKYFDSELTDLGTDIRSLSFSETSTEDDKEKCTQCNMSTKNLRVHQKLNKCKVYGYEDSI